VGQKPDWEMLQVDLMSNDEGGLGEDAESVLGKLGGD